MTIIHRDSECCATCTHWQGKRYLSKWDAEKIVLDDVDYNYTGKCFANEDIGSITFGLIEQCSRWKGI